jgi:hypothetical protein
MDRFTLTKLRRVGDEEKTILSCLDARSPMIAPPVLPQSAFCALKKNRLAEVRSFQVFDFRPFLSAWRVSAELQLKSQSETMWVFGVQRIIFNRIWERVDHGCFVSRRLARAYTVSGSMTASQENRDTAECSPPPSPPSLPHGHVYPLSPTRSQSLSKMLR